MTNAKRPHPDDPLQDGESPPSPNPLDTRQIFAAWLGEQLARRWIEIEQAEKAADTPVDADDAKK